jgi:hypothetical protein
MTIYSGTSDVGRLFFADGTSGADAYRGWVEYGHTGNEMTFGTNGGTKLTLTSAGNLGLGVAPSAWRTDFNARALQLNNASFATFNDDSLYVAQNSFLSATGWKYISTNAATTYVQNAGTHSWNTAASGTAGNPISFTTAMALDASGNLLVGSTSVPSPVSNYKSLVVGGTTGGIVDIGTTSTSYGRVSADSAGLNVESIGATTTIFRTNSAERGRFTSGGFLKASNGGAYNDSSASYHELRVTTNTGDWAAVVSHAASTATNQYGVQIKLAGDPNTTGNEMLFCNGAATLRASIRSNGGIANYQANDVNLSDRREKTNFAPAGSYLDKICAIPVQTFNYIDQNLEEDDGLTLGVVAQDVQAVAPELVMESNWAAKGEEPKMRLSIYQTDLQYALMKALQELKAEFDAYKASHP